MDTRLGIELSPSACRIVEIEGRSARRANPRETAVRSFTVLPASSPATRAHLDSLRGRSAAVVVWGAESTHRQVIVTDGSYEAMRLEGVAALAGAGVRIPGAWSDIAFAPGGAGRPARRPVVVALASGPALSSAVQPLVDAGIRVRTVMTPAVALGSLARLRRSVPASDAAEAYVAVEEDASCIALVRDGALMAARDLSWGYLVEREGVQELRAREDVAARLADELREFIADVGGSTRALAQVMVCGGLPGLRGMALQLVERIDIDVEPLDSMFGIDDAGLGERSGEFRERGAELRLAWVAAADQPPAHNLLRARRRAASHAILARAAVLAGMAAGLGVGVDVAGSSWWKAAEPMLIARANVQRATPATETPMPQSRAADRPVARTDAGALTETAGAPPQPARPAILPPPLAALVAAREPEADGDPPASAAPATPAGPMRRASASVDRSRPRSVGRSLPDGNSHRVPQPAGEPFHAALGSILYSSERRLAVIDGRIVGAGDEVHGAQVVDIAPGVVVLRDAQGRLTRLLLDARGR